MGRPLSKYFFLLIFISQIAFSQNGGDVDGVYHPKDYKDQGQFKHFYKRREAVSRWQINQLKEGALVVRLHQNKKVIEGLKKRGQNDAAQLKEFQTMAINKNIIMAFTKYYTFSKVYFMYGDASDSLLNGARKGIFVDTNLTVDPTIEMKEKFYMIGEHSDVYNSSIGFVKEDTARKVKEIGTVTGYPAFVMKNKYGHQTKDPFPVWVYGGKYMGTTTKFVNIKQGDKTIPIELDKSERFEKHSYYVVQLNKMLTSFYNSNKGYEVKDPDILPYCY